MRTVERIVLITVAVISIVCLLNGLRLLFQYIRKLELKCS